MVWHYDSSGSRKRRSRRGRPSPASRAAVSRATRRWIKLCGPGEWLVGKRAARARWSWRKLHIGVDADTGQIIAAELTSKDVDDGSQVGPLLEQIAGPLAPFTGHRQVGREQAW